MKKKAYRVFTVLFIFSFLLVGVTVPASAAPWRDKVDPWVLDTAAQGETEFLVFLSTQADLTSAKVLPTKLEKGTYVYQTLSITAEQTQKSLIARLDQLGVAYRSFWIANMVWVRGDLNTIQLLAARSDVAHLYANPTVKLDAPVEEIDSNPLPQGIEWNILKVNADDVWAQGFNGQGVVIGGQDTGYQWNHPALINQYRGWDGDQANHNYNWIDETADHSPTPIDPYGHGTHTMGTMVGDDGGYNQIGMAPGARWIGCRNMDAGGNGTPETYAACYQWFVAPTDLNGDNPSPELAPDVISNSWSCPPSEGCTDPNVLLTVVQNLVAAGIVSSHSAGNSGSNCSTINEPAAIYDESFTVGATDSSDNIAGFSSRGPVTVDGSNRPKPDISAPGVSVRSSVPNDGYASFSGTSMASPHVAGEIALLISANPDLRGQVDQIESTIEQSAYHISWSGCGSDGVPNSAYGWGRIDALAAVNLVDTLALGKVASESTVLPGDLITYTLTVTHATGAGPTTNVVLTDTLPAGTTFVSASEPYSQEGSAIQWGFSSLDPLQAVSVDLTVQVDITATGSITNANYAVSSDQVGIVYGPPVVTPIEKLGILELSKAASAESVYPGELLTYTLSVGNTDDFIEVANLVLTDTLPLKTTFVSATLPHTQDGEVIRWDFASLAPHATENVSLVVMVDLDAFGSVTNADYGVRGDLYGTVRGSPVTTELQKLDFLQLGKTASASDTFPGDLITYTLTITNAHPTLSATNLVLTDTLPVGTAFVSSSLPYTLAGDVVGWSIPSLKAQGTLDVLLVVQVDRWASGTLSNADYGVTSDQAAFVQGEPVSTAIGQLFFLPFTIKTP